MGRIKNLFLSGALVGLMSACAVAPTLEEREQIYLALSDQHFEETLNAVDDPLNPSIEIDTERGHRDYIFSWGLKNDQFLRANIIRESGTVLIQGYVLVETTGDFLRGTSVSFAHSIDRRDVDRIGFDVSCNASVCVHREDVVFELTREELQTAVTEAERLGERTLVFRIQGQSGQDRDGRFHVGEVKALLGAVAANSL
ncbi:MAG: hypothetical protein NXH70_09800 [Hyphomonas sp.]|nr:hypothetical protein [Hyphomonas sp.]